MTRILRNLYRVMFHGEYTPVSELEGNNLNVGIYWQELRVFNFYLSPKESHFKIGESEIIYD